MIYILNSESSKQHLSIKGEQFKYLHKVRRHSLDDEICFRNEENIEILHRYKVVEVEPRRLKLELISSKHSECRTKNSLHIGWCVIDINSTLKVLPSLCEMGVEKISFIYCERSQKNIKLDFKRFQRIVEVSMQQSGRTTKMEFNSYKNLSSFIQEFEDVAVLDFDGNAISSNDKFSRVLIGCEGGFSQPERELLSSLQTFRLNTPMVLQSQSAVVAVASKMLV